ncbi:hypothetical protein DAI22_03g423400 [Oryza sativa Japonica Group]|uniref:Expressed protein n=1 Tax=Oryza sativa subsp. japonica TaxID=39947 RepID=Q10A99_ORYSJ|nr:expressed protein [Oryza sativa Japonica Group]KAF2942473.1 hypothetical protein DAI22_03g423400 [Oryza sativa Japonica Group]KAF2942474.1 hypothetical protein DAI22_03g423400 [Oryza sativa Japonica Group]
MAIAPHRAALDPRGFQGPRGGHHQGHGGVLQGDLRPRRNHQHHLPAPLPCLPPPRMRRGGRLCHLSRACFLGTCAPICIYSTLLYYYYLHLPNSNHLLHYLQVRLEALTDFCWLCENPQKLVVPFDMRGYQGVYNLERRIYEGAVRGLSPVQGPLPVNFPLPDPTNPLSLNPGSLQLHSSRSAALDKSPSVTAAIAGARAAATQYSRNNTAITSTPTEETRQRFSRENHADNTSGPSIVHDRSPVLQNQNLPSLALTNPPYLKNQTMPSFVQNNLPNLQNHNLSYLPHQNLSADVSNRRVSLLQNQSPSSLLQSGQSYLQNQNAEPRRSPRLQNEPPSRWH